MDPDDSPNEKLNKSLDEIIKDQDPKSDEEFNNREQSQNGFSIHRQFLKSSGNEEKKKKEPLNDPELKSRRIFVGNLSFKTSWHKVKEHMREAGNVVRVDIFTNKDGRSKGCGLVEFSSLAEADKAINQLNQTTLDGRQIFVRKDDVDMAKHDHEHYEKQSKRNFPRDRNHSRSDRYSRERPRNYHRYSNSRSSSPRDRRYYERTYSRERSYSRRPSPSRSDERYRIRRSRSYGRDDRHRGRDEDRNRGKSRSRSRSLRRSRSRDRDRDNRSRERDNRSRDRDDRSKDRERNRNSRSDKDQGRGYQIIVKNIPWSVTWQQLKDAFREYGPIIRAEVPQDTSGRSKGYGFVRFEREKDARDAIDNMDRASFNGREITVKWCDN